jgi:hypothetical protein
VFFNRFKDTICVHRVDARKFQEDSGYRSDNLIYRIARHYIVMPSPGTPTDVIPIEFAHSALRTMVGAREVLAEQVEPTQERLQQVLAQPMESVLPIAEQHVGYWLSKRHIQQITARLSGDDKDWKPEDLARQICQAADVQRHAGSEVHVDQFGDGRKRGALNIKRMSIGIGNFDGKVGGGLGFAELTLVRAGVLSRCAKPSRLRTYSGLCGAWLTPIHQGRSRSGWWPFLDLPASAASRHKPPLNAMLRLLARAAFIAPDLVPASARWAGSKWYVPPRNQAYFIYG